MTLCRVLRQDTLSQQCIAPLRIVNLTKLFGWLVGKKFRHLYWSDFLHGENKRYNIPSSNDTEIRMSHGKIYNLACDHKFLDPP